jgi:hypothetical protein
MLHGLPLPCLPRMSTSVQEPASLMTSRRPVVDHHTYTPKVRVSTQQPWGSDEERGLIGTKCQKHSPQSPRELASILTIAVGLRGHSNPTL